MNEGPNIRSFPKGAGRMHANRGLGAICCRRSQPQRLRDKIDAYSMRSLPAIPVKTRPLLRRFRHGRPDRGRRPAR